MRLRGKKVVITGASSGIGAATALEAARRGASVVLAARRADRLQQVAASCRSLGVAAEAIVTDVRDRQQCIRLLEACTPMDVLVNAAGYAVLEPLQSADPDTLRDMMDTNYFGAVWCTQAALPDMLARGSGTIVNVSSITGIMGVSNMGGYGSTKSALITFTEALRDEVIDKGVRVALVCPGTTETEFFLRADRARIPAASRLVPVLDADEVARAVCDAAEDAPYRSILPFPARLFMRSKELAPRLAHFLMRRVSALLERR
jgi:short-subunit dehydrogenase